AGTPLSDVAQISGAGSEANLINNSSTASATVLAPTIDLSVYQYEYVYYPYCYCPGGTVQIQLGFSNNGNSTAQGVTITDTLPTGFTHVANSDYGWCYTCSSFSTIPVVTGNQIVYSLGDLTSSGSGSINFYAQIDPNASPGTVTNLVQISGTGNDTNLA